MCVILYTEINGKKILAKNRDRAYKPSIKIIHELINGVEIAYLKDEKTGWIEGMNANGTGIVNSTLSIYDYKINKNKLDYKKNVIYNSLLHYKANKNFLDLITNAKKDYVLEGHTLIYHNDNVYHIENTADNKFIAERINKPCVYSNHGIRKKDAGFTACIKGLSSFLRSNIMKHELKENHINSEDELTNLMNQNYPAAQEEQPAMDAAPMVESLLAGEPQGASTTLIWLITPKNGPKLLRQLRPW